MDHRASLAAPAAIRENGKPGAQRSRRVTLCEWRAAAPCATGRMEEDALTKREEKVAEAEKPACLLWRVSPDRIAPAPDCRLTAGMEAA